MTLYSNDPTYSDIKEEIRGEIHENHIGEISGNKLQKVLVDMVDDKENTLSSYIGNLSQLSTTDKSNIVAAVNEVVSNIPNLNIENGSGPNSIVQKGGNNEATASLSMAIGINCSATGERAFAQGNTNTAAGNNSHAEGYQSNASGNYSHAEGYGTLTNNIGEHAEGKYNKSNPNTIHSVGIGTSNEDRKNAIEVMQNGDVYLVGVGNYTGEEESITENISSLQTVLAGILNSITVINEKLNITDANYISVRFNNPNKKGYSTKLIGEISSFSDVNYDEPELLSDTVTTKEEIILPEDYNNVNDIPFIATNYAYFGGVNVNAIKMGTTTVHESSFTLHLNEELIADKNFVKVEVECWAWNDDVCLVSVNNSKRYQIIIKQVTTSEECPNPQIITIKDFSSIQENGLTISCKERCFIKSIKLYYETNG